MSRNYDNWEQLVEAVLRREKDRQLAFCESFSTTASSADFTSFRLSFNSFDEVDRSSGQRFDPEYLASRNIFYSPHVKCIDYEEIKKATGNFDIHQGIKATVTSLNNSNGVVTNSSAGFSQFSTGLSDDGVINGEILATPNIKVYSYADLKTATRNFRGDMVLGLGGFGTVYKGWVDEKTLLPWRRGTGIKVAIKKLNEEIIQGIGWEAELDYLGKLSHPNLVKLLGHCLKDQQRLLVYEFMAKGSLENLLFRRNAKTEPLSWEIRLRIAIGAAKGLAFLHSSDKKVIFRDFKASNILLDGSYNAKISDFMLAKMGPTARKSHVTTQVIGTWGYAAPEYLATCHLSVKSDIYGFGVVLLEMLTGLRAFDTNRLSEQHYLVDWLKPILSQQRKLKMVMDHRIEGQYSVKAATEAAKLTLRCLELEPHRRPSMEEVVGILLQISAMG